MEAIQSYPNLLSEKQAAKRLGIVRITLLRACEAGRIRFFRIGSRVLYCAEQLTEFLEGCERNRRKRSREVEGQAPRKDNRLVQGEDQLVIVTERTRAPSLIHEKRSSVLPFVSSR